MLKKTITYKDLDGNNVTEDFYFNLSKAEITEMELSTEGGLANQLRAVLADGDPGVVIRVFKKIVLDSVGKRSEDGKRFIKNETIRLEFEQTDAYSTLFMELLTNAEAAAEFVIEVIPSDVAARVKAIGVENVQLPDSDVKTVKTIPIDQYTVQELRDMPTEEFQKLVAENKGRLSQEFLTVAMQRLTK